MQRTELEPGDILQIRPESKRYGGQFCVFVSSSESSAVVKAYIKVREGVVYMTFGWEDLELTGGRTVWRVNHTVSQHARPPMPGQRARPVDVTDRFVRAVGAQPRPADAVPEPSHPTTGNARGWAPFNDALSTLARQLERTEANAN